MKNKFNTAPNVLCNKQNKNTFKKTQLQTIFEYLSKHTVTASMVTEATGIPQKCITRYKRDLEKIGQLWETEKKPCKQTGFKAWYLTTNPNNAPKQSTQTMLF